MSTISTPTVGVVVGAGAGRAGRRTHRSSAGWAGRSGRRSPPGPRSPATSRPAPAPRRPPAPRPARTRWVAAGQGSAAAPRQDDRADHGALVAEGHGQGVADPEECLHARGQALDDALGVGLERGVQVDRRQDRGRRATPGASRPGSPRGRPCRARGGPRRSDRRRVTRPRSPSIASTIVAGETERDSPCRIRAKVSASVRRLASRRPRPGGGARPPPRPRATRPTHGRVRAAARHRSGRPGIGRPRRGGRMSRRGTAE